MCRKQNKIINVFSILYILCYFFTMHLFDEFVVGYLFYTFILILGNYVYSLTIRTGKILAFKYIVFIIINVAYFVKFYAVVYVTSIENNSLYKLILLGKKLPPYMDLITLYNVFSMSTVFYLVTALSFLFADKIKLNTESNQKGLVIRTRALIVLILLTLFVFIVSTFLRLGFKETPIEPFVIVLNTFLVPLLYVFLIIASINSRNVHLAKPLAVIFILSGLFQFALFGSKLYIILPVIWVLIVQSFTKFILIKPKLLWLSPIVLLAYPLFNFYREALHTNSGGSLIFQVIERLNASETNVFYLAFFSILHRFIGVDSFAVLQSARDSTYSSLSMLDIASMSQSITQFLTYEILAYDFKMGVATSLFGELYFLTGNMLLTVVLLACLSFFICVVLRLLLERSSLFANSLGIYFIIFFSLYFNEGIILFYLKYQLFTILFFFLLYKLFFIRRAVSYAK